MDRPLLPAGKQPKLLSPPREHGPSARKIALWGMVALLLLGLVFLVGYIPRHNRQKTVEAAAERAKESLPQVNVTPVRRSPGITTLLLPGNITPLTEAYIYARATGYVRRRYADIGDRVRQGQVLADIEAPDLDAQVAQARAAQSQAEQQLHQARAQFENAQAQEELARVTWERYRVLADHGAVSRQEADQQLAAFRTGTANVRLQQATISAAEENVRGNRANVERLIALQEFEHVRAPFSGVVTARNFDIGAFISGSGASVGGSSAPNGGTQVSGNAGNAGASGSPSVGNQGSAGSGELYRIAQIGTLRILVDVPQENAPTLHVGQPAEVFVQEFSNRKFPGKLTRTANQLDRTSRTLLAEVQVANPQQILLPGMYAQVQFADVRGSPPLMIPGDSLIAGPEGPRVAILLDPTPEQRQELRQREQEFTESSKAKESGQGGEGGQGQEPAQAFHQAKRVHLQPVQVGRDYGPQIEITGGLQGWEHVIVNPEDAVQENALVYPRQAPALPGQNNAQPRGPSDREPSSIGSPSREAPTQGPQTPKGGGGKTGNGDSGKGGGK
jgi:multidrug efflux pump subunit AcrA (membrane-fusion protein)